jgi:hypothetical protein
MALASRDSSQIREEILMALNETKGKDQNWASDLPRIFVSSDWQW